MLQIFLWDNSNEEKHFHKIRLNLCCVLKDWRGMGNIVIHIHALPIYSKWTIKSMEGEKGWEIILMHCITYRTLLDRTMWGKLNIHALLIVTKQYASKNISQKKAIVDCTISWR